MRIGSRAASRLFAACLITSTAAADTASAKSEPPSGMACLQTAGHPWGNALGCYVDAIRKQPLRYERLDERMLGTTRLMRFELHSQDWPEGQASPAAWLHEVRIFVPVDARRDTAVLVVDGGTRHPRPDGTRARTRDNNDAAMVTLAERTRSITVQIRDVPNQYLLWPDGAYRTEDDSVAQSWKYALQGGDTAAFSTLHLPMAAAVVRAMDLAGRELKPWNVERFIVTGISKRGWATWLAALADTRVAAIAPIAIDVLDLRATIERTRKSYGGHWPLAFLDYQSAGILRERDTPAFAQLMQLEDPLAYLDTAQGRDRLSIPKYIVSASGDDFFIPDSAKYYLPRLPQPVLARALPNSSHGGVAAAFPDTLIPFVNRIQNGRQLPRLSYSTEERDGKQVVHIKFDEQPARLLQWTAANPNARDFRYACGIRYSSTPLPLKGLSYDQPLPTASSGWTASFIEAQFADGLTVTTPVDVWPVSLYPQTPPTDAGPACRTLSDS